MSLFYIHQKIVKAAHRARHSRFTKAIPIPMPQTIPAILWLLTFALVFNCMVSLVSFQARL